MLLYDNMQSESKLRLDSALFLQRALSLLCIEFQMADLVSTCPHCQRKLKLRDPAMLGKKAKCPACQQVFVLTADDAEPESPEDFFEDPETNQDDDFDAAIASQAATLPPVPKKKKKGAKKQPKNSDREPGEYSLPVHYLMMAGTGFLGGIVGALLWALMVYILPFDTAWGAIVVGVLVGGGVRLGASKYDYGWGPAITALLVSLFAITMGKAMAYNLEVWEFNREFAAETAIYRSETGQIAALAQQIWEEKFDSGEFTEADMQAFSAQQEQQFADEDLEYDEDYQLTAEDLKRSIPPVIWTEAEQQYATLSEPQKAELLAAADMDVDGVSLLDAPAVLSIFDLFFFILAGGAAFSTAAGWDLGESV